MVKFKLFTDYELEEQYLEKMAKKGYMLTRIGYTGMYIFKKVEPCDVKIRVGYRFYNSKPTNEEYWKIASDRGWTRFTGSSEGVKHYFINENNGDGELFNSEELQVMQFKNLLKSTTSNLLTNLLLLIFIVMIAIRDVENNIILSSGFWTSLVVILFIFNALRLVYNTVIRLNTNREIRARKLELNLTIKDLLVTLIFPCLIMVLILISIITY